MWAKDKKGEIREKKVREELRKEKQRCQQLGGGGDREGEKGAIETAREMSLLQDFRMLPGRETEIPGLLYVFTILCCRPGNGPQDRKKSNGVD